MKTDARAVLHTIILTDARAVRPYYNLNFIIKWEFYRFSLY